MENNLMPHQNTKNHYDPVILFLSIHPKEEKYPRFMHIYTHGSTIHNNQEMEVCAGNRPRVNRPGLHNMLWKQPYYWCQITNPPRWMQLRLTKSQASLMASFKPAPSVGLFGMGDSEALILQLAKADLELPERTFYQKNSENICHKIVRNQREREWMDGSSSTYQPVGEWVKGEYAQNGILLSFFMYIGCTK